MNKEIIRELLYEIDTKICTPVLMENRVDVDAVRNLVVSSGLSKILKYVEKLEEDIKHYEDKIEGLERDKYESDDKVDDLQWNVGVLLDKLEDVLDEMGEDCIDTSRIDDIVEEIRQEIS